MSCERRLRSASSTRSASSSRSISIPHQPDFGEDDDENVAPPPPVILTARKVEAEPFGRRRRRKQGAAHEHGGPVSRAALRGVSWAPAAAVRTSNTIVNKMHRSSRPKSAKKRPDLGAALAKQEDQRQQRSCKRDAGEERQQPEARADQHRSRLHCAHQHEQLVVGYRVSDRHGL